MSDLNFIEKNKLEKLFRMEDGYVLAFSNPAFRRFVIDSVEQDIESGHYDDDGGSKAKRLRCFWTKEPNNVVGKLVSDLIDMAKIEDAEGVPVALIEQCEQVARRLLTEPPTSVPSATDRNSTSQITKDFFVSYNSADSEWAEWIAWTLEEIGYSVVIQAWDFRPGGNFILDMQKAATETKRTVMVLSDNYVEALYTQPEWAAAFVQDPTSSNHKLLPIKVASCTLEGMLSPLIYVDFVGKQQKEVKELLISALQERAKPKSSPDFPDPPSSIPPVTDFPGDSSSISVEEASPESGDQCPVAQRRFSSRERLAIIQKLNSLPLSQFEEVVFALKPPSGVISSDSLSQESQTKALLIWLESPEGSGLKELDEVLELMLSQRSGNKDENTGTELIQELIKALSLSQRNSYDFRGAQFSGGFAETVHGSQVGHLSNKEEKSVETENVRDISSLFPLIESISLSERYFTQQIERTEIIDVVSIFPSNRGCVPAQSNRSLVLLSTKGNGYWVIRVGSGYCLLPGDNDFSIEENIRTLGNLYVCSHEQKINLPIRIYELATVAPLGKGEWQLQGRGKLSFTDISLVAQLYNLGNISYSYAQDIVEYEENGREEKTTDSDTLFVSSVERDGDYWVLSDGEQYYLVPKTTALFDKLKVEALSTFYSYSQKSDTLGPFWLIEPAVVVPLSTGKWQLVRCGKMAFD